MIHDRRVDQRDKKVNKIPLLGLIYIQQKI